MAYFCNSGKYFTFSSCVLFNIIKKIKNKECIFYFRKGNLMGRKSKVSNELKVELVKMILEGKGTIQGLSKEYNVAKSSLMTWKKKYLEIGEESIKVEDKNRHYSRETKDKAVKSYLNNEGSLFEICKKYDIASVSVLNYWIRDYRRSIDENGKVSSLKKHVRKLTIRKFGISYQQIYSWVKKYEKGGIDALADNRGKRHSETKKESDEAKK